VAKQRTPAETEAALRARVVELGGRLAEGAVYVSNRTPVLVVCGKGHCRPKRPGSLLRGEALCRVCAGKDPEAAKEAFLAEATRLGGRLADDAVYVDTRTPVELICGEGHACSPRPNDVQRDTPWRRSPVG
jgi:hypothetical protein